MREKDRKFGYITQKLREAGITNALTLNGAKKTVLFWMRKGRLTFRRLPNNNFKVANDTEINEIVEAFRPGGSGEWHAKGVTTK